MTIEEYFGKWSKIIDLDEVNKIMKKLTSSKEDICPLPKDMFKAFHLCDFNDLRLVIIGKDPYSNLLNNKPVATGIAFANRTDTPEQAYSPSLVVLKESVIDFTIPHRRVIFDSSLEKWEEQGVLMLNSALSCKVGQPGSHTLLWRPFMKSLLTNLSRHAVGIVYLLMGEQAQSLEPYICHETNHVIRIRHPSYYARTKKRMPSDVWKQIDDILIGQNGYGIKWYEES